MYFFSNMMQKDYLNLIKTEKITKGFFAKIKGKLLYSKFFKIKTYSSQNLKVLCINYYIEFCNEGLFGRGDFLEEIYPRYRKMRNDWRKKIEKSGIKLYSDIAVGFFPLLNLDKIKKIKYIYKKEVEIPLGEEIISIDAIKSKYYKEMAGKFNVKFALKEKKGMFVGPERGMLFVLETICSVLKKINCFVDVGAGTGELSAYVLKKIPQKVVVNELSQKLKIHLKKYLKKIVVNKKTKIIFSFKDCRKIKFPSHVDVISVSIFYGVQPAFLECKGREMVKSLGRRGVMFIQSSMPETFFNQHILMGDKEGLKKWSWFSKKFILSNYFSCVESFFIDNQFIILASQSHGLVNKIIRELGDKIISYKDFN